MNKRTLFLVFGAIFLVLSVLIIIITEGELREIGMIYPLAIILSITSFYLSCRNKNLEIRLTQVSSSKNDVNYNPNITTSNTNTENSIPQACPSCKSPNNKRLALCEYCGNPTI